MKTENLTLVEAWQALLDGKCLRANSGYLVYKIIDSELKFLGTADKHWLKSSDSSWRNQDESFSIVEDPSIPKPKSLSFEEAMIYIDGSPEKGIKIGVPDFKTEIWGSPTAGETSLIWLAIKEGWPITQCQS